MDGKTLNQLASETKHRCLKEWRVDWREWNNKSFTEIPIRKIVRNAEIMRTFNNGDQLISVEVELLEGCALGPTTFGTLLFDKNFKAKFFMCSLNDFNFGRTDVNDMKYFTDMHKYLSSCVFPRPDCINDAVMDAVEELPAEVVDLVVGWSESYLENRMVDVILPVLNKNIETSDRIKDLISVDSTIVAGTRKAATPVGCFDYIEYLRRTKVYYGNLQLVLKNKDYALISVDANDQSSTSLERLVFVIDNTSDAPQVYYIHSLMLKQDYRST
jgi:hypothetical protein